MKYISILILLFINTSIFGTELTLNENDKNLIIEALENHGGEFHAFLEFAENIEKKFDRLIHLDWECLEEGVRRKIIIELKRDLETYLTRLSHFDTSANSRVHISVKELSIIRLELFQKIFLRFRLPLPDFDQVLDRREAHLFSEAWKAAYTDDFLNLIESYKHSCFEGDFYSYLNKGRGNTVKLLGQIFSISVPLRNFIIEIKKLLYPHGELQYFQPESTSPVTGKVVFASPLNPLMPFYSPFL